MGSWGYGIFEDDFTADIRGKFEDGLAGGATVEDATRAALSRHADSLADPDEGPLLYLALAVLQLEHGEVQRELRDAALEIINQGKGLGRWEEVGESDLGGRRRVYDRLKFELLAL